jgi:CubicO group peptidase (beta-lactamase class C family)
MIILLSVFAPAMAQNPLAQPLQTQQEEKQQTATPTGQSTAPQLTAADVEAFLDGVVPLQLAREDIAGATVAVVKDGKVIFSKGYGYSDVATKKPVIPETTMFRPGSVSKLFTWTSVMQLVEQGKLDLDKDVNEYIDFKIPEAFGKPITLKNLLTHTPGFEEQVKDLITNKVETPNLGNYLKTHIPTRIFAPGTVPAYSNYGAALAGYIVERVSGEPFDQYVQNHIFKPLGMTHSTFDQPLPADMTPNMSSGYSVASDKAKPFETVTPAPAGSLSSTAIDMAQFIIAHLQNGKYGDTQILKPETAQLMHSRLFGLDPAANAMAYGFYEEARNGHRIIGHAGDTECFHSDLHLVLDAGVGFFISYNSAGRGQISPRTILWERFLDRYFPYTPAEAKAPDSVKQDIAAVSGTYEVSRRSESSFFKTFSLLGEAKVYPAENDTIQVDALLNPNGKPKSFQEIAPMQFREVDGQDLIVFKPDETGRMQLIIPYPFMMYQKVGLWSNGKIMLPVVGLCLFVMLLALLLWPIGWFIRRHYDGRLDLTGREWLLRVGVRLSFLLMLIFIGALLGVLIYAISNLDFFSGSGVTWIEIIQVIGVIASLSTLIVFVNFVLTWMSSRFRIWGKLQATIFALVSLGFLWFVFAGHLLYITSSF